MVPGDKLCDAGTRKKGVSMGVADEYKEPHPRMRGCGGMGWMVKGMVKKDAKRNERCLIF